MDEVAKAIQIVSKLLNVGEDGSITVNATTKLSNGKKVKLEVDADLSDEDTKELWNFLRRVRNG